MDQNTYDAIVICCFLFVSLGWVPILALGKAISWIVLAFKNDNFISEENEYNDTTK